LFHALVATPLTIADMAKAEIVHDCEAHGTQGALDQWSMIALGARHSMATYETDGEGFVGIL